MSKGVFYPPTELPDQVVGYAQALKTHATEYGAVPANGEADLAPLVVDARKLQPLAQEIADLELTLAAKMEQYHRAAAPLWTAFSEKVGQAKLHAEKQGKAALLDFVRGYRHHAARHAAAKASAKAEEVS